MGTLRRTKPAEAHIERDWSLELLTIHMLGIHEYTAKKKETLEQLKIVHQAFHIKESFR